MSREDRWDTPRKEISPQAFVEGYKGKNKYKAQEKRVARKTGGRRQPMSGALPCFKGDVSLDSFLIDAKQTIHKTMSVQSDWLRKINREASDCGKYPALSLEWANATEGVERDWILIPISVFNTMLQNSKTSGIE